MSQIQMKFKPMNFQFLKYNTIDKLDFWLEQVHAAAAGEIW